MNFKKVKDAGFLVCLCSMFALMIDVVWILGIFGFLIGAVISVIGIGNEE